MGAQIKIGVFKLCFCFFTCLSHPVWRAPTVSKQNLHRLSPGGDLCACVRLCVHGLASNTFLPVCFPPPAVLFGEQGFHSGKAAAPCSLLVSDVL